MLSFHGTMSITDVCHLMILKTLNQDGAPICDTGTKFAYQIPKSMTGRNAALAALIAWLWGRQLHVVQTQP